MEHVALAWDAARALLDTLDYLPRSLLRDDVKDMAQPQTREAIDAEFLLLHDVRLGLGREPSDDPPLTGVTGPIDFGPHLGRGQLGDPFDKSVLVKEIDKDCKSMVAAASV
jgi:hypothetical protein